MDITNYKTIRILREPRLPDDEFAVPRLWVNGVEGFPDDFEIDEFDNYVFGMHPKAVQTVMWTACILKWKIVVLSPESATLVSPDGKKTIGLSARTPPNQKHIYQMLNQLRDHGDPLQLAVAEAFYHDGIKPKMDMVVEFDHPAPRKRVQKKPVPKEPKPRVIDERPFLSHLSPGTDKRPGLRYPSKVIIERKWSDGSVDYVCAFPTCDHSSKTPHGISSHWKKHVNAGEVTAQRQWQEMKDVAVEDIDYDAPLSSRERHTYTPRQARVLALARVIDELKDSANSEEIAEAVLQWIHEQSETQSSMSAESEPMSDAEILNRIRRLVDRGEYLDQRNIIEEQAMKLNDQASELDSVKEALEKARAETDRMADFIEGFHDMSAEYFRAKRRTSE